MMEDISVGNPILIGRNSIHNMTRDELNAELEKGLDSIEKERTYTAEEVNKIMKETYTD